MGRLRSGAGRRCWGLQAGLGLGPLVRAVLRACILIESRARKLELVLLTLRAAGAHMTAWRRMTRQSETLVPLGNRACAALQ